MSAQSAARAARRECKVRGHVAKTDGQGNRMCARCMAALSPRPTPAAGEVQSNG